MTILQDIFGQDFMAGNQGFGQSLGEAGSGISSIIGAFGSEQAASSYDKAASAVAASTALKLASATRQGYQAIGQNQAAGAASGFTGGGSVEEAIRSTSTQVGLTKAAISLEGRLQEQAYEQQAQAASNAAIAGFAGGALGLVAGIVGL